MFEFLKKYAASYKREKQNTGGNVDLKNPSNLEKKANGTDITIESHGPIQSAVPALVGIASRAENKPADTKQSNVFTDLFPATDKTKTDDQLVESLNASTKTKSILKPAKGDEDLLIYKKPALGTNLFKLTVLIILLVFSYLYSQLSPTFNPLGGQNAVQKRMSAYERVLSLQSKINKQNYILAKYALDDFLYTADSYLHKTALYSSTLTSQKDKLQLEKGFPSLRAKMREDLFLANDMLSLKLIPDNLPPHPIEGGNHANEFKKALKDEVRANITASAVQEETEFMRDVSKLADNTTINPALGKFEIPTMTDIEFAEMLSLLSESNTSSFGTLNALRQKRVKWSELIEEIEKITKSVDPLFDSKLLQQRVGEIFYSSYTLDQAREAITVIGETLSDDGKNFTLSADLLDAFEKSAMFKTPTMDSFTKSKEQETSYKGILSIDLTLEK